MTVARRWLRWTMGVWCVLLAVAMWSTPGQAAEFRIAVGVDPDTLDPLQLTTTTVGNMVDYMVETLTQTRPRWEHPTASRRELVGVSRWLAVYV